MWRIEIVGEDNKIPVSTVTSKIRIVHYLTGCALHSNSKQLPSWGYEQLEVSCNPRLQDFNNIWNIEDNYFPRLPNVSFEVYAPTFLESFLESHAVMLQGNSGLKPKKGEMVSKPWQWPINIRGQFFSVQHLRIYLLGNPVIWWANLILLMAFLILKFIIAVQKQRNVQLKSTFKEFCGGDKIIEISFWLFLGWALHYLPFFAMSRILYFHHYFPAVVFNSMLSAVILNYLLNALHDILPEFMANSAQHLLMGLILTGVVYSFILFSPLAYGIDSSSAYSSINKLKWLDTWEF